MKKIIILIMLIVPIIGDCFQILGPDSLSVHLGVDTTICAGDSILLSSGLVPDSLSFNWSTGDTTAQIVVSDQGTYSLSVTNNTLATFSDTIKVTVLSRPMVQLNVDSVCLGNRATFKVNANHQDDAVYAWNFGDDQASDTTVTMLSHLYGTAGMYTATLRIKEMNGCADSSTATVQVWPLPNASFVGLEAMYCANDRVDTLRGFPVGGIFTGATTLFPSQGLGVFSPGEAESNIQVTYLYTDLQGCQSGDTQYVFRINPVPEIDFSVPMGYCLGDDPDTIYSNTPGALFSGDLITERSDVVDELAVFDPNTVGTSMISLAFTNEFGCSNLISKSVFVTPLPVVNLGNDTALFSGGNLTLFNIIDDPNWDYLWSTMETSKELIIDNPGFYVLSITDRMSGCMASDTILVDFANSVRQFLPTDFRLFPNPGHDYIDIDYSRSDVPPGNYKILDSYGRLMDTASLYGVFRSGNSYRIRINDLAGGTYYFILNNQIWKFIKM